MVSTHGHLSFLFPTNYLIPDYNAFGGVETPVQINLTESVSAKVVGFNCKFLILYKTGKKLFVMEYFGIKLSWTNY